MGACTIDEDRAFKKDYLKDYFIHGIYADGTMFERGPMKKAVASEYLNLHGLGLNKKSYEQLKSTGFSSLTIVNCPAPGSMLHLKKMDDGFYVMDANSSDAEWDGPYKNLGEIIGKGVFTVIKLDNGFYIKSVSGQTRIGPFTTKALARTFALAYDIGLEKGTRGDSETEPVAHITYPTFAFSYTMRGVPCMDIVVAETLQDAMKRFDLQWHVFDNSRPIKSKFSTLQDLVNSMRLLFIKDIEVEELNDDNLEEYLELADATGNPSTIPQL